MDADRFNQLMEQAEEMENSPTKVAILEEAVRIADVANSLEDGIYARYELVVAAQFSGANRKSLMAFSWMLARFDSDPTLIDQTALLWLYKWIYANAGRFPTLSKKQLAEIEKDITRRYVDAGSSLHVIYAIATKNGVLLGDLERAKLEFNRWQTTARDNFSDCEACDRNSRVYVMASFGRDAEAVRAAEALIESDLGCDCIPESTYALILAPLMRLGQLELANKYHQIGYPKIAGNPQFLTQAADHLMLMVYQKNFVKAVRCLERHLPIAMNTCTGLDRLEFLMAAQLLIEGLLQNGKRKSRKFRIPDSVDVPNDQGKYQLTELFDWFKTQTSELLHQFDERNGNSSTSDRYNESRDLVLGGN